MMATTSDMVASELAELLIVYLIRAKLSVGRKRKEKKQILQIFILEEPIKGCKMKQYTRRQK